MILFIIWGTKGRTKTAPGGNFFCPRCQRQTPFQRITAKRWFTLYFIPLFPVEKLGEWAQCAQCQGQYDAKLLELTPEQVAALTAPWACSGCGNRNPSSVDECVSCRRPRRAPVAAG